MANLDDELSLSSDGSDADLLLDTDNSFNYEFETVGHSHSRQSSSGLISSCTSLVDSLIAVEAAPRSETGTSVLYFANYYFSQFKAEITMSFRNSRKIHTVA